MLSFASLRESLLRRAWLLGLLLPPLALGGPSGEERPSTVIDAQEEQECFVLEWRGSRPHPARAWTGSVTLGDAARRGQVGLVEFRRVRADSGWQLELEAYFPFEEIRLLAVECLNPSCPRLVWREINEGKGRTVFAEWTARSRELRALEWGFDGSLREKKSTSRGAVMPHYLLELVRRGRVTSGTFKVFDPLERDLVSWSVQTSYRWEAEAEEVGSPTPRQVEFRREDGTLAGRYVFRGTRLLSFQWQEGEVHARAISRGEYDELRTRWRVDPEASEAEESGAGVKDV